MAVLSQRNVCVTGMTCTHHVQAVGRNEQTMFGRANFILLCYVHAIGSWMECAILFTCGCALLTIFNTIAIQGTPQMAVDNEAICLSRVYSYHEFPVYGTIKILYCIVLFCIIRVTFPYFMCLFYSCTY